MAAALGPVIYCDRLGHSFSSEVCRFATPTATVPPESSDSMKSISWALSTITMSLRNGPANIGLSKETLMKPVPSGLTVYEQDVDLTGVTVARALIRAVIRQPPARSNEFRPTIAACTAPPASVPDPDKP